VREELNTPTFSAEEVSRIVAEAGKYQMLYILLAATGMRIGEAMALPVSRVVDNCTTLQVRHTYWEGQFGPPKHNSKRDIDLPEAVAAPFRQYLGGRTDGYVFQTNTGRPDSEHNIATRFFYPLLKTHGIEHKKGSGSMPSAASGTRCCVRTPCLVRTVCLSISSVTGWATRTAR